MTESHSDDAAATMHIRQGGMVEAESSLGDGFA